MISWPTTIMYLDRTRANSTEAMMEAAMMTASTTSSP